MHSSIIPVTSNNLQRAVVIGPRGNGLDAHRTWESLYLGRLVVTKASSIDVMFDDLPVLSLPDWSNLEKTFVVERAQVMASRTLESKCKASKKMFITWWICEIAKKANRASEFCSVEALLKVLARGEDV